MEQNSLSSQVTLEECAKWCNPHGQPLPIVAGQILTNVDGEEKLSTANSAFRHAQGVQPKSSTQKTIITSYFDE